MAHVSIGQTSKMCHRLGTSLQAGVDITQMLEREARVGSSAYRRHMGSVAERVGRGNSLAESMQDCHGYFSPLTCELVGVGEETGRLDQVLFRLADHYQHLLKLRRTFLLGVLWPAVQLFGAICIIGGVIVLPPLLLGVSVPIFGLSGVSGGVIYAAVLLGICAVLALFGLGLARGWFGPLPGRMLMYVPVVGKAIKTLALARLSWTLSLALGSGVDAGRSIRLALQSTQLHFFTRHIGDVESVIQRGGQFHEALEQTGAFPKEFLTALQNAELSGTESESLAHMSQEYQRQAETASTALAFLASVVIWVLVIALLVFMIFYMFMNLYMKPIREAMDMGLA